MLARDLIFFSTIPPTENVLHFVYHGCGRVSSQFSQWEDIHVRNTYELNHQCLLSSIFQALPLVAAALHSLPQVITAGKLCYIKYSKVQTLTYDKEIYLFTCTSIFIFSSYAGTFGFGTASTSGTTQPGSEYDYLCLFLFYKFLLSLPISLSYSKEFCQTSKGHITCYILWRLVLIWKAEGKNEY